MECGRISLQVGMTCNGLQDLIIKLTWGTKIIEYFHHHGRSAEKIQFKFYDHIKLLNTKFLYFKENSQI